MRTEGLKGLGQEYPMTDDSQGKARTLRTPLPGRIIITNDDPNNLPRQKRTRVHEEAAPRTGNDVSFDPRP